MKEDLFGLESIPVETTSTIFFSLFSFPSKPYEIVFVIPLLSSSFLILSCTYCWSLLILFLASPRSFTLKRIISLRLEGDGVEWDKEWIYLVECAERGLC